MASSTIPALSLHVNITIDPENVDKFLGYLKPAYDGVCAEPECVYFEVFQDPEKPGRFRFVEHWNCTKEWFMSVSCICECIPIRACLLTLSVGSTGEGVLQAIP